MMRADHQAAFEQLMACLDGELGPAEAAAVRAHVTSCHECQEVEAELRDVTGRLQTWTVGDPPVSLKSPVPISRITRMRGWLPIAALLVVAVGAGMIWLGGQMKQSGPEIYAEEAMARPAAAAPPPAAAPAQIPALESSPYKVVTESAALSNLPLSSPALQVAPLLARTARLSLVVASFDSARVEAERIIAAAGGFIGNITISGQRGGPRSLVGALRVPGPALDETLAQLRRLGRVTIESREAEDVTQQSADLDARLTNARTAEKRLNAILATRTGKLEDVLNVEREIVRVRGEIEQMEAERRTLDRRTTYGTIQLEMIEEQKAELDLGDQSISTKLRNALVGGWNSAFNSILDFTLLIAWAAPTLLLWGLALIVPYRFVRRRFT